MKKIIFIAGLILHLPALIFSQAPNTLTSKETKEGWALLFDGKSLSGWTTSNDQPIPDGGWEIKDGILSTIVGPKGGDIITAKEYSNFELVLEYNVTPACNSGIKYFFTTYNPGGKLGCEFQILDDVLGEDAKQANHRNGSLYDLFAPDESKKKVNAPGEWNSIKIVVKDKKIEHWLNGIKILEVTRGDQAYLEAVTKSKYSRAVPTFGMGEKGHILLQYHQGLVYYKNIKIREL
jgi:hypothetical protein